MIGIRRTCCACIGSAGGGFSLVCSPLRHAHQDRPDADRQERRHERRRVERQQAEQIDDRGRIRRRQVVDPAIERRMAHLDGDEQHFVEREEHRNCEQHRQAARHRVHLLALVQLHHLLLLLGADRRRSAPCSASISGWTFFIFAMDFAERLARGRATSLDHDGEAEEWRDQNCRAACRTVQHPEERLGDESEPAPIDREVEARNAERVFVVLQRVDDLGPGEEMMSDMHARRRRRGRARAKAVVGFIGLCCRRAWRDRSRRTVRSAAERPQPSSTCR